MKNKNDEHCYLNIAEDFEINKGKDKIKQSDVFDLAKPKKTPKKKKYVKVKK